MAYILPTYDRNLTFLSGNLSPLPLGTEPGALPAEAHLFSRFGVTFHDACILNACCGG